MADLKVKISEFPLAIESKDSDDIAILQDGINKRIKTPKIEEKILEKVSERFVNKNQLGVNNGVATLGSDGLLSINQRPVFDVKASFLPINLLSPPSEVDGVFVPTESGVYENYGNIEIDLDDGAYIISKIGNEYTKSLLYIQNPKSTNTISELRLRDGDFEGQVITLLGYYEAGDKDPLNYTYTTEIGIDNGGSVINTETGSWIASTDRKISVLDFGAIPDGVFDSLNSINNSLSSGIKEIIIPKGTYFVSNSIIVHSETRVNAKDAVFVKNSGYRLLTNSDHVNGNANITVEGIIYDGRDAYIGAINNIYFDNVNGLVFKNNKIKDLHSNLETIVKFNPLVFNNCKNITVVENNFKNSARCGISIIGASGDVIVSSNFIDGVENSAISITGGYENIPPTDIYNLVITNNIIKNCHAGLYNQDGAIDIYARGARVIVSNNIIDGFGIFANDEQATPGGAKRNQGEGIRVVSSNNIIINNNVLRGSNFAYMLYVAGRGDSSGLTGGNNINVSNNVCCVKEGSLEKAESGGFFALAVNSTNVTCSNNQVKTETNGIIDRICRISPQFVDGSTPAYNFNFSGNSFDVKLISEGTSIPFSFEGDINNVNVLNNTFNFTNDSNSYGFIRFNKGVDGLNIKNNKFPSTTVNVVWATGLYFNNTEISSNYFNPSTSTSILLSNVNNLNINKNSLKDSSGLFTQVTSGVDVSISNNYIKNSSGIRLDAGVIGNIIIENNSMEGSTTTTNLIQVTSKCVVRGNLLNKFSTFAISCGSTSSGSIIENNVIDNTGGTSTGGIDESGSATDVIVKENKITNSGTLPVRSTNASNLIYDNFPNIFTQTSDTVNLTNYNNYVINLTTNRTLSFSNIPNYNNKKIIINNNSVNDYVVTVNTVKTQTSNIINITAGHTAVLDLKIINGVIYMDYIIYLN